MSSHWPGGEWFLTPLGGGGEENFVRGGIGGGTKVKFLSWRQKFVDSC